MLSRKRILLFAVGMIAALGGSAMTTYLRGRHCMEQGGEWILKARACTIAGGTFTPANSETLAGMLTTLALAVVLYRGADAVGRRYLVAKD